MNEEQYKKDLAEAGVDVPEDKEPEEKKDEPEKPAEKSPKSEKEPAEDDKKPSAEDEPDEPLQTPNKPRKRSIYEDYKDKKSEAKTEKERADKAEQENIELKQKLENLANAKPEDKKEAEEEAETYAESIGADPALVRKIIADARKGFKPEFDESIKKDLEDFKAWKNKNGQMLEKQMFDDEFKTTLPALKTYFPDASPEEMDTIKGELDKISHTKEWHDKSLKYIAFENQDTLSALVSPKKRGMESKGRKDVSTTPSKEFDPNADYSKMSLKEREAWEEQYKEITKSTGLMEDAQGRKMIL